MDSMDYTSDSKSDHKSQMYAYGQDFKMGASRQGDLQGRDMRTPPFSCQLVSFPETAVYKGLGMETGGFACGEQQLMQSDKWLKHFSVAAGKDQIAVIQFY